MIFLPIVERELRVASRHRWTYWGRAVVALGAMGVMGWIIVMVAVPGNSAKLAQALFSTLSGLCFGLTLFAGILFSADSLSRERREGTLGLLFLTDLGSVDIALGKLAATSLNSIYCLVAVLPVLAIPLILGGVTGMEYLRVVAVLLVTLWLALTTGLLASSLAQRAGSASGWAALLMILACGGLPTLAAIWQYGHGLNISPTEGPLLRLFYRSTPFVAFWQAFGISPSASTTAYMYSLAYVAGTGLLALIWATVRLPGLWQDTPTARPTRAADAAPDATRAILLALGPVVWLSNRSRSRRWLPWFLLLGLATVWLLIRLFAGSDWNQPAGWITTSLVVHFCFKIWLSGEAPRVFHEERRSGGMELLLTTGLTSTDLIAGRLSAVRHLYVGPWLAISALDLVMFGGSLGEMGSSNDDRTLMAAFWLGRLAMLWLDAEALLVTGSWIGLSTTGQRTTLPTWSRIVALPYLLWMLGLLVVGLAELSHLAIFSHLTTGVRDVPILAMLVLSLNFGVSGFWWWRYTTRLRGEFRERANRSPGRAASA